jgi:hypothetical protein
LRRRLVDESTGYKRISTTEQKPTNFLEIAMGNIYNDPSQAPFEYNEEGAAQIRALLGYTDTNPCAEIPTPELAYREEA